MNTSVNTTASVNPTNFVVPSFIDANFIAGRLSVGIYHMADRTTTDTITFTNAANALNYAFLLKKRHGITIARRAFELIMWEVMRTGAISTRAQRKAEAAEAIDTAEHTEPTPPTEPTEKPKRKRAAKKAEVA